jgi:hypothetical protein
MYGLTDNDLTYYTNLTDNSPTNLISSLTFNPRDFAAFNPGALLRLILVGAGGNARVHDDTTLQSNHDGRVTGNIVSSAYSSPNNNWIVVSESGEIGHLNALNYQTGSALAQLTHGFDGSPFTVVHWDAVDGQYIVANQNGQVAVSATGPDP